MAAKLNLDKLDLQIIHHMMENAEISYAELGKKLFVPAERSMFVSKNYRKRVSLKVHV
jgi:hypothetical protein